ncbi:hypothetical protein [Polaribacter sp. R77954]|uniref:hypothetical protein n=1 Tax=Polaribacter sp. R77954 TaxID=3093870 RepID=UPI0037C550A9
MKLIKKIVILSILLLAVFSFVNFKKNKNLTAKLNLEKVDIIALLNKQEMGCRPSDKVMFYVDTEIIKKYRGFSEIRANIYIVDRVSGTSSQLSSGHILLPNYNDTVIANHTKITNNLWTEIQNGDKLITDNNQGSYGFKELIQYKFIYNSYLKSTNKLLNIKRV